MGKTYGNCYWGVALKNNKEKSKDKVIMLFADTFKIEGDFIVFYYYPSNDKKKLLPSYTIPKEEIKRIWAASNLDGRELSFDGAG